MNNRSISCVDLFCGAGGLTQGMVQGGIEVTAASGTTISISPVVVFSALGLSLLGGIIAGILPAIVAARTRPAESLRRL